MDHKIKNKIMNSSKYVHLRIVLIILLLVEYELKKWQVKIIDLLFQFSANNKKNLYFWYIEYIYIFHNVLIFYFAVSNLC